MKIKIQDRCKTINNQPVKVGDIVDVDANTARNLIKKLYASAADDEAKKLDLDTKSLLSASQAQTQIAATLSRREAAKAADQKRQRVAA